MSEAPFVNFYTSDFLAGTGGMTASTKGVYITLLCLIYEDEKPLAQSREALARRCGCTLPAFEKALAALVDDKKMQVREDGIWSDKCEKHIASRCERRNSAKAAAEKRWQKAQQKQGGQDARASSPQCKPEPEPEYADTNVSGAIAPIDFAKAIFDHGVRYLVHHGTSEQSARALVGKWRQKHDDREIFEAFKAAKKSGATDPKSYIAATLGGRHGKSADETDRLQRIVTAAAAGSSHQDWG